MVDDSLSPRGILIVPARTDFHDRRYGPGDIPRIVRNFGHVTDDTGKIISAGTRTIVKLAWARECFDKEMRLPEDNWIIRWVHSK